MLTVLIWLGSGFAFGMGVLCGVKLMLMGKKPDQTTLDSLEELRRRNDIGNRQAIALEEMAAMMNSKWRT